MAATLHHEYVILHRNGAAKTIRRNSAIPALIQSMRALQRRPDLQSIAVFKITADGCRHRVAAFHDGNTARPEAAQGQPGRVVTTITVKPSKAALAPQAARFWNFSNRKIGGLRFIRIGRLSISFCLTSKPV